MKEIKTTTIKDVDRAIAKRNALIKELYADHDCYLSPEDGCEACEKYWEGVEHDHQVDILLEKQRGLQ